VPIRAFEVEAALLALAKQLDRTHPGAAANTGPAEQKE
jgi:hypothetical protein